MKTSLISFVYKYLLKPIYFKMDPEDVHDKFSDISYLLGRYKICKSVLKLFFNYKSDLLEQNIVGIDFHNPVGLAAGFDYDAKFSSLLSDIGFGFNTVGTVTNLPYEGNPKPRLARLPKSKSLLVNKGFKSSGAADIICNLSDINFDSPLGISIGRSNSSTLNTLKDSIEDIITSFKGFESSKVNHSYYELNISCPNLIHGSDSITFYPSDNLELLLTELDKLSISRPVFIKMPITESDSAVLDMLKVITTHNIKGVVIGNLEKNKNNPLLDKSELLNIGKGNFSGKPCYERSNALISLAYKNFGDSLIIMGVGGIFSAQDAYEKIKSGASLVQLITGMIYQGPQLIGEINRGLVSLIKEDGYSNISQAVGANFKNNFLL